MALLQNCLLETGLVLRVLEKIKGGSTEPPKLKQLMSNTCKNIK